MSEQPQVRDLAVVHAPHHTMLLAGLPPVYAHGMSALLAGGGLPFRVVPDLALLPGVLAGPGPFVVVMPAARAVAVLPDGAVPAGHVLVVVVDTLTPEACAAALRAGVTGLLSVDDPADDVLLVLRAACQGRVVLPRAVATALCRPATVVPPALLPQEQEWLRRLAAGGTVSGLARSCGYSEREMYRRLSALYLRLGARTRTEALLLAERFGLLSARPPHPGGL